MRQLAEMATAAEYLGAAAARKPRFWHQYEFVLRRDAAEQVTNMLFIYLTYFTEINWNVQQGSDAKFGNVQDDAKQEEAGGMPDSY